MEATRVTNESVRNTSRSSSFSRSSLLVRFGPKNRPMILIVEKGKGAKASGSTRVSYGKKEARRFPMLLPSPCRAKKAATLLGHWVKDRFVRLLEVEFLPSITDKKDERCTYHRIRPHWCSALLSEEFLKKSIKLMRLCSKKERLVLTIYPFSKHITKAKAK